MLTFQLNYITRKYTLFILLNLFFGGTIFISTGGTLFISTDITLIGGGYSVSSAGDINGDGLADFIIGAPVANQGVGEAYVIYGKQGGGYPTSIYLTNLGDLGFTLSGGLDRSVGHSVSSAGDINGDGLADFIIGADCAAQNGGAAYVIYGKQGGGYPANIDLTNLGDLGFTLIGTSQSGAGFSVSSAGDINGDGIVDFIIGAPSVNQNAGAAYVIYGKPPLWLQVRDLSNSGDIITIANENIDSIKYAIKYARGNNDSKEIDNFGKVVTITLEDLSGIVNDAALLNSVNGYYIKRVGEEAGNYAFCNSGTYGATVLTRCTVDKFDSIIAQECADIITTLPSLSPTPSPSPFPSLSPTPSPSPFPPSPDTSDGQNANLWPIIGVVGGTVFGVCLGGYMYKKHLLCFSEDQQVNNPLLVEKEDSDNNIFGTVD